MGHACTHDQFPGPNKEHPVVAVLAVIAIIAAMLLIGWARLALHGTDDIEEALLEPLMTEEQMLNPRPDNKLPEEREVESAVTSTRFATGFSP
jgi:hypothetical protein